MKKLVMMTILMVLVSGFTFPGVHGINLKTGVFIPFQDSELWEINRANLAFGKADMVDLYYSAEYEYLLSKIFSLSLEGGVYKKEVFSAYRDFEFDDGFPIEQNLALRITSVELGFKLYPIGYRRVFYPYLAGGPGIYFWKYEQWGWFIDSVEGTVDQGYADTSRVSPGFHAKLGFVLRVGRATGLSFETRYLYLKDNLGDLFQDFDKLDMTGLTFNIGIHFFLW